MQGQRGTIGSLPEILEFSHGSASGNPVVNQPICWNNILNPVGNRTPNYMLAPNSDVAYVSAINQEQQNLSGWSLGEPNFSGSQNEVVRGVQKREDELSSSATAHGGTFLRSEEWRCDPPNALSLGSVNMNPLFLRSSNSEGVTQNLNLNADFDGNDHQASEFPNLNKSSGSVSEHIQLAGSSNSFLPPSGSGGYLVQENDDRPNCSLDGRRASCKRKSFEGSVGQSSMDGSANYLQLTESSLWRGDSGCYNEGTSLSISPPPEQSDPRLCARASDSVSGSMVTGSAEGSHRNFRLRITPNQQEPTSLALPSIGNAVRYSSNSTSQQSSRLIPVDHSLDLRSASASDNAIPQSQSQSTVFRVPPMLQNVQSFGWNESSSSRAITSANAFVSNDRNTVRLGGVSSRSRARSIQEHPLFVPATELRSRNQTTRTLTGVHINIPGNVRSTATASSSSGVHRLPAPHWVPHPHPPLGNTRLLPEYVCRSLFSSIDADSGGQNNSLLHSAAPSSDERALPSGAGNHGHHHLNSRSMSWMERQGDGALGIPYPLRTLASAGEGRSRLGVSEQIRNVLDLMRRGENIRFEDVMLLNQSVFLGGADLHDRHRDMRLDVDNMSYEELLALEERIGNVSTGLSEEITLNRLKQHKFSPAVGIQQENEPCCVCQEEYNGGEDIGTLDCGHDFHAECIKEWLKHKNLCPICKTTGLAK